MAFEFGLGSVKISTLVAGTLSTFINYAIIIAILLALYYLFLFLGSFGRRNHDGGFWDRVLPPLQRLARGALPEQEEQAEQVHEAEEAVEHRVEEIQDNVEEGLNNVEEVLEELNPNLRIPPDHMARIQEQLDEIRQEMREGIQTETNVMLDELSTFRTRLNEVEHNTEHSVNLSREEILASVAELRQHITQTETRTTETRDSVREELDRVSERISIIENRSTERESVREIIREVIEVRESVEIRERADIGNLRIEISNIMLGLQQLMAIVMAGNTGTTPGPVPPPGPIPTPPGPVPPGPVPLTPTPPGPSPTPAPTPTPTRGTAVLSVLVNRRRVGRNSRRARYSLAGSRTAHVTVQNIGRGGIITFFVQNSSFLIIGDIQRRTLRAGQESTFTVSLNVDQKPARVTRGAIVITALRGSKANRDLRRVKHQRFAKVEIDFNV